MGDDVRGEKQIAEISEILILRIDIRIDYVKNIIEITQLTKYQVIRLKECFDGVVILKLEGEDMVIDDIQKRSFLFSCCTQNCDKKYNVKFIFFNFDLSI